MFSVQTQQAGIGRTNWDGCMSGRWADGGFGYTRLSSRCPCQGTALGHQHRYRTAAALRRTEHGRCRGAAGGSPARSPAGKSPPPRGGTERLPAGCRAPPAMPRRGLPAAGPNRCGSGSAAGRGGRGAPRAAGGGSRVARPAPRSSRRRAALQCARGCCT